MLSLKNYFVNLSIFELSDDLTTDEEKEHEHRSNIMSTRIFFIIFIIVLFTLAVALKTRNRNILITIENPSEDQFINLPPDAHCPCSRVSLSYGEFISIEPRFHQICSSDFISDRWIKAINFGTNTTYFSNFDFRTEASAVFQSLESLCQLSKDYAIQSIDSFNKDLFISQEVLQESIFQSQINSIIQQFQLSSPIEFSTQLKLVRKLLAGNRFLSALQTDYMQWYVNWQNDIVTIVIHSRLLISAEATTSCTCRIHIDCKAESFILDQFGQLGQEYFPSRDKVLMEIPGMSHGCLPVNTILLSTLECFYNQTCLENLITLLSTSERFTAISQFKQSSYSLNSTIQTIVDNLMIEEWMNNIAYEKYYTSCAPILCSYFTNDKYDWKFVLTQLIGLLGALILACSLIINNIVKFIRPRPFRNVESIPCKFNCFLNVQFYFFI